MDAENAEQVRLAQDSDRQQNWKRWGPYLSDRQWATVREDYSPDGSCWTYFPHEHARSRAYRWGEDGLLGICDRQGRLCFSMALWNGQDAILKERLFGLTGLEGNHGEDVKECYYHLDSTPTHSYMKALYKYPHTAFPYHQLAEVNGARSVQDPEFELLDTSSFSDGYWDVFIEYAKASANSMAVKTTIFNRGNEEATIHALPTLWYRNTWIWGCSHEGCTLKPHIIRLNPHSVRCSHQTLPPYIWTVDKAETDDGHIIEPTLLFTENETNSHKLFGVDNYTPFVKDAFHRYVVNGEKSAVNPQLKGTKVAAWYVARVRPGGHVEIRSRLYQEDEKPEQSDFFGQPFQHLFEKRILEADQFYRKILPHRLTDEEMRVARQALAGLLWSKQFYHYIVRDWLGGDEFQPSPPASRRLCRNSDWLHLFNKDVLAVPDKWEYPWYASWDLAFHMIPYIEIDPEFAKDQLILLLREWYMHPNGQIPAYEFAFSDVNPPVHAWAVRKVFRATNDYSFLARCFHKLILNFTWWVNRKDPQGRNIFSGGFLGLDNIGIFDRSKPLPVGGQLEQADGTAWMAFFCVTMLDIALTLAQHDPTYEDMASKFFEHLILIVDAINNAGQGGGLWHEQDGFYFDFVRTPDGQSVPLRIRSMVGIVPLFACLVLDGNRIESLQGFVKRTEWFIENRSDLFRRISYVRSADKSLNRILLAIPTQGQLKRLLSYLLDEAEFLSPFGIRSLSKVHETEPFIWNVNGQEHRVDYVPGESTSYLFGGNSNWRGPIWFPMNYLVIESLKRYHYYYGDEFKVECPTGSGIFKTLDQVAKDLARRLSSLFLPDEKGNRPCHGDYEVYSKDPHWKELVQFHEYFHGETGRGCGANHQTGWTALVINCLLEQ